MHSSVFLNKVTEGGIVSADEKDVIKFLYMGEMKNCERKVMSLIELANKYNLYEVKSYCEDSLIKTLSVNNVLERFIFASKNGVCKLKQSSLEKLLKENKRIMNIDNWRNMAKENADVVMELVMEFISKNE